MTWKPISSSNLKAIDYDENMRVLHVQFQSGRIYSYQDVEPDVAAGLEEAASPGRYLNERIKNRYRAL